MSIEFGKIVDISLELDPKNFAMRTPAGFTKDVQFEMEVIKEHDAPGGAGQIVRGVHMRLHAGSHVDAPEHNVRGGTQIHQLPLELFIGDAVIADLRDKMPGKAITENDLERAVGARIRKGDRLLLRTDPNNAYDGQAILGTLNKNLPFDPIGDFAAVSLIGDAPTLVNVAPSLGVRTLTEFVELAKAKPGAINYGSAGVGTATHLAGMYFAAQTGTDLVHVPYTVSSTIIADLLGGRIHVTFAPAAFTLPLLQDGRLLALAVAANEPIREPIAVPTALAAHIDYQNATWYGFL